jgi:hypothetical protein
LEKNVREPVRVQKRKDTACEFIFSLLRYSNRSMSMPIFRAAAAASEAPLDTAAQVLSSADQTVNQEKAKADWHLIRQLRLYALQPFR